MSLHTNLIKYIASDEAYFGNQRFEHNGMRIEFGLVSWDAIQFSASPVPVTYLGFERWFEKWMDIDASRKPEGAFFGDVIHSARIDSSGIEVDFGSAPV